MIKNYKDLSVWQKAMDLVAEIYRIVKYLPQEERYALSDQMRRSAVSIPSNIAEGNARGGKKDYENLKIQKDGNEIITLDKEEINNAVIAKYKDLLGDKGYKEIYHDTLDNEYTFAQIQKAMVELDEINKEIISLKFIEDKSYEEIAQIL